MPIFKVNGALVYYAHVPKCGGTAVEAFLKKHFGLLAFLDTKFNSLSESQRWTSSSPQHVDAAALARLFPEGFLDLSFAVVRHPAERLRSVFLFQRDIEEQIAPDLSFSNWLAEIETQHIQAPTHYDNHIRPMSDLVPKGARIFRLEDGLDQVAAWLATLAPDSQIDPQMPRKNTLRQRLKQAGKPARSLDLHTADHALISRIYAADFARFGYPYTSEKGSAEQP